MSFSNGVKLIGRVGSKLESYKKEITSGSGYKAVAASMDPLLKITKDIRRILEIASKIEELVAGGKGREFTTSVCTKWYVSRQYSSITLRKLKPLLIIRYDGGSDEVSLSDGNLSIKLSSTSIKLSYNSTEIKAELSGYEDVLEKIDMFNAVLRRVLRLIDAVLSNLLVCAKNAGVTL